MLPTCQQPLRFEPFLRPMVWGGRRLQLELGKNLPTEELFGESWEVSDHPSHRSRLVGRPEVTLRQLMETQRRDLLGPSANRWTIFPWLIKLLDANDWLSVQVHPDEEAVQIHWPGEAAKTEAWYILSATPESRVWAGLKPGVGPDDLREAIEIGTVADYLHAFTPRKGDFVYLPAGTVHAVGGGVCFAEIQQTSDATFRLFDWNRRDAQGNARTLHVDQGLASIHWTQGPIHPLRVSNDTKDHRQRLVACRYFEVEHVRSSTPWPVGGRGQLQALIVTEGHGRFGNGAAVTTGEAWILPAAMPAMPLHPATSLAGLLCTLPIG